MTDGVDLARNSMEDDCRGLIVRGNSEILSLVEANKPPPAKKSRREKASGKLLTASSSTETMEQLIWKELPEDLLEAVIARLPVATCFRFPSVCKKWNTLLTSSSFSQYYMEVRPLHPWFYTITHENINNG